MEFRQDINALRALAVIAVVLYHFRIPGFDGGFIGVDVFFVISGFLMTSIIVRGLENNKFSILSFYWARAKRILPALMALCAVIIYAGWFILPPSDYKELGQHVASAIGFVSNFVFKSEEGYFDTLSQEKWLLHTWSLSVEWQFYILYPLLLWWQRRHIKRALIITALLTLALSIGISPHKAAFSFYILPTRIWELVAGGLVYLYAQKYKLNDYQSIGANVIGFVMIAMSIALFSGATPWPGHAALLPIIGAMLMIWSPRQNTPLLSFKPIQRLGDWSYSIYLWHWPILVALRYYKLDHEVLWIIYGIALSILLGAVSYYLIETPIRKSTFIRNNPHIAFKRGAVIFMLLLAVSFSIWQFKGFPSRVENKVNIIEAEIRNRFERPLDCDAECQKRTPHFVVWGDSHAGALFTAVYEAAEKKYGRLYNVPGCPMIFNVSFDNKKNMRRCPDFNKTTFAEVQKLPDTVPLIIISRFSFYTRGYNENPEKKTILRYFDLDMRTIKTEAQRDMLYQTRLVQSLCEIKKAHPRMYVVKPVPEMGIDVPHYLARQMMLHGEDIKDISLSLKDYYARHAVALEGLDTARKTCGIKLLDPLPYLCKDGKCAGSINLKPLYSDDDHLSESGNKKLVPLFTPIFRN